MQARQAVCWTCGPEGSGDLSTGTAGMSIDLCPLSLPVEVHSCSHGMLGTFAVVGDGVPILGIDFLEDFPLLILAVQANFELGNSSEFLLVDIFPFSTGSFVLMLCLIVIL